MSSFSKGEEPVGMGSGYGKWSDVSNAIRHRYDWEKHGCQNETFLSSYEKDVALLNGRTSCFPKQHDASDLLS